MVLYKSVTVTHITLVTKLHIYTIKDSKDVLLNLTSFMFQFEVFFSITQIIKQIWSTVSSFFFVLLDHHLLFSKLFFSSVMTSTA